MSNAAHPAHVSDAFIAAMSTDEIYDKIVELMPDTRYSKRGKTREQLAARLRDAIVHANEDVAEEESKQGARRGQAGLSDADIAALDPAAARKLTLANINKALKVLKVPLPADSRKASRLRALESFLTTRLASPTAGPTTRTPAGDVVTTGTATAATAARHTTSLSGIAAEIAKTQLAIAKLSSRLDHMASSGKVAEVPPTTADQDVQLVESTPAGASSSTTRAAWPRFCVGEWFSKDGLPGFAVEQLMPSRKPGTRGFDWEAAAGYSNLTDLDDDIVAFTPSSGLIPPSLVKLRAGAVALKRRGFAMVPTVQYWTIVIAQHMRQHKVFPSNATDSALLDHVVNVAPPPPAVSRRPAKRKNDDAIKSPRHGKFQRGSCSVHKRTTSHSDATCWVQHPELKARATTKSK